MQSTQVRHGGLELPIAAIAPQEGFNPRRHFDPAALDRLAASIKAQGVVQAITVRPRSDGAEGYWIVAGERRWRSAKAAGLTVIPAVVRDYDDATALAVASVENEHRENISAAEEARIARRAVDAANGDVDESARMLGWTPAKVNARLLLLHAIDEVLDAVASKTILLGHAELLSTLPPDVQRRVLPNVISNKATVETLRSQLAQFTQELAHAPFETEGCRGCPNNSAVQSSLFEFHVGSGRCSNKPCWDSKRSEALDAKKAQVATEVNVVFFDKEKDPATYTRLEALGPRGVGEPQMQSGCKGCAKFGAVVSTAPGKEGRVAGGLCFDLGCHAAKVAEYQATLPPPPASNGEAEGAVQKAAPAKTAVKKGVAEGKAATPGSPVRVLTEIWRFFRREGIKQAEQSPRLIQAVSLYALMRAAGKAPDVRKAFSTILRMTDEQIAAQIRSGALHLLKEQKDVGHNRADGWEAVGAMLMADQKVELEGRFEMSREFVEAHTKSGLEALLAEAGFENSLEGKDEAGRKKSFRQLMGKKSAEIVEAVMTAKHDFSRFVPKDVLTQFNKLSKE